MFWERCCRLQIKHTCYYSTSLYPPIISSLFDTANKLDKANITLQLILHCSSTSLISVPKDHDVESMCSCCTSAITLTNNSLTTFLIKTINIGTPATMLLLIRITFSASCEEAQYISGKIRNEEREERKWKRKRKE